MIDLQKILKRAKAAAFNARPFNLYRFKKAQSTTILSDEVMDAATSYILGEPFTLSPESQQQISTPEGQQSLRSILQQDPTDFVNKATGVVAPEMEPPAPAPAPQQDIVTSPTEWDIAAEVSNKVGFGKSVGEVPEINLSRAMASATKYLGNPADVEAAVNKAIQYNFGPPDPGNIDQRINFFLKNPKYLPGGAAEALDVFVSQSGFANANEQKKASLGFLSDQYGSELSSILLDLVRNDDPIIEQTLSMAIPKVAQQMFYDKVGGREKQEVHSTEEQLGTFDRTESGKEPIPGEIDESVENVQSSIILPVLKGYLLGTLDKALAMYNSVSNTAVTLTPETSGLQKGKISAIRDASEEMDLFVALLLQEIREMSMERSGRKFNSFVNSLRGSVSDRIVQETLARVQQHADSSGKTMEQLPENEVIEISKAHLIEIEEGGQHIGWTPPYATLVDANTISKNANALGKIKKKIHKLRDSSKSRQAMDFKDLVHEVYNHVVGDLSPYFGEDESGKKNFIVRTLQQSLSVADKWIDSKDTTTRENRVRNEHHTTVTKALTDLNLMGHVNLTPNQLEKVRQSVVPVTHFSKGRDKDIINFPKENAKFTLPPDQVEESDKKEAYDMIQQIAAGTFEKKRGGFGGLRSSVQVKVPNLYALIQQTRDEKNEFGPNAAALLTDLVIPRGWILTGEQEAGRKSPEEERYVNLYYDLTKKDIPPDVDRNKQIVRMKQQTEQAEQQKGEEIKRVQKSKLKPEDKQQQIAEIEDRFSVATDTERRYNKYKSDVKILKTKKNKRDKIKGELEEIKKNEIISDPTDVSKGRFKSPKAKSKYDRRKKDITSLEESINALNNDIKKFERQLSTFASESFIRMIYSKMHHSYDQIHKYTRLYNSSSLNKFASSNRVLTGQILDREMDTFNSIYKCFMSIFTIK